MSESERLETTESKCTHTSESECSHHLESKNPPSQRDDVFRVINLTVSEEGKTFCYSCKSQIEVNGVPFPRRVRTSLRDFEKIGLSFENVRDFLKLHDKCPRCGRVLLLSARNPIAVYNNLMEEDLNVEVHPECVKKLEEKIVDLVTYYKFIALNQQPESSLSLIYQFPHYFFFKLVRTDGKTHLHLDAYSKHLVGPKTLENLQKSMHQLSKVVIEDTMKRPEYSSKLESEGLGLNFYDIDQDTYKIYPAILFLDIDGTSTRKTLKGEVKGRISTVFFRLLAALEERKYLKTVIATGRPCVWAFMYMLDLGLDPLVIGNNGTAVIYRKRSDDFSSSKYHFKIAPTEQRLLDIVKTLSKKYHLKLDLFVEKTARLGQVLVSNQNVPSCLYLQKLINQDPQVRRYCEETNLGEIVCEDDGGGLINIKSSYYNKFKTAQKLLRELNYQTSKCFNIGNATNDIPFTRLLGENSYGVANSQPDYAQKVSLALNVEARGATQIVKRFLLEKGICTRDQFQETERLVKRDLEREIDFIFSD